MKFLVSFLFLFLSAANSFAALSPDEFCAKVQDPSFFKDRLSHRENLFYFYNRGGFINGGVCWWHTLFQRNVAYLAVFRPELPRATDIEVDGIIRDLIDARGVVEIPGFENFYEFSRVYEQKLQFALETWQIADGVLLGGWMRSGSSAKEVSAEELEAMMDETYDQVVRQKRVAYQMLKISSLTAHSWLVLDMEKTKNGYRLTVLDSNFPSAPSQINYERGMTRLYLAYFSAVPYTSRNTLTFYGYRYAHQQYCSYGVTSKDMRKN